MSRPRLLDLFCGAGGAAMGYSRAGFDVVGVDIAPQPRFPFEFIQADAIEHMQWLLRDWNILGVDAIHASPPCPVFSRATRILGTQANHPNLIPQTRELLLEAGLPYVIENVEEALQELREPIMLCGSMFDPPLDVKRHRLFEANWDLRETDWPCRHKLWTPRFPVRFSHERRAQRNQETGLSSVVYIAGSSGNVAGRGGADLWRRVMEMPWATSAEVGQAVPPRYTEFIGHQLIAHIETLVAA